MPKIGCWYSEKIVRKLPQLPAHLPHLAELEASKARLEKKQQEQLEAPREQYHPSIHHKYTSRLRCSLLHFQTAGVRWEGTENTGNKMPHDFLSET